MGSIDFDKFRASTSQLNGKPKRRSVRVRKAKEWFLKGPIPGAWLSQVCKLPRGAILVALAVRYLAGVKKSSKVELCWRTLQQFHLERQTAYRALKKLEKAKLVSVKRSNGSCP